MAASWTERRAKETDVTRETRQFDQRTVHEAAAWYARTAAENVSSEDWTDLDAWLDQDPEHRRAFEATAALSRSLQMLGTDERLRAIHDSAFSGGDGLRKGMGDRGNRWFAPRQLALAASVLAALIVPTLYYMGSGDAPQTSYFETAVAERRSIELDDGSSRSGAVRRRAG